MSDLIERLRKPVAYGPVGAQAERDEAADELERSWSELLDVESAHEAQIATSEHLLNRIEQLEAGIRKVHEEIDEGDHKVILGRLIAGDRVPSICEWFEDDDGWHGSCGQWWEFTHDGPKENEMKHCMKCGKPIVVETAGVDQGSGPNWRRTVQDEPVAGFVVLGWWATNVMGTAYMEPNGEWMEVLNDQGDGGKVGRPVYWTEAPENPLIVEVNGND